MPALKLVKQNYSLSGEALKLLVTFRKTVKVCPGIGPAEGCLALFATDDHLPLALDESRGIRTPLSRRVSSYYEFTDVILHLKNTSAVRQTMDSKGVIASAGYLLGWFLGDLGKTLPK